MHHILIQILAILFLFEHKHVCGCGRFEGKVYWHVRAPFVLAFHSREHLVYRFLKRWCLTLLTGALIDRSASQAVLLCLALSAYRM